jgi:hypothetical protein
MIGVSVEIYLYINLLFNFSAHFRGGRGACAVLSYRLSIHLLNPYKSATTSTYDPQRKILRMRANPACVSKSVTLKRLK